MSASRRPISATLVANLLTVARVPLALLIWVAPADPVWVASIVVAAALSDMADGWTSRRLRLRRWRRTGDPGSFAASTGVGAWLDSVCDKIFVASAFAAITTTFSPPLWCVLLVLSRELILLPAVLLLFSRPRHERERIDYTADWPGKATTVGQFMAIGAILFLPSWLPTIAIPTGLLGALAAIYYIRRELRSLR